MNSAQDKSARIRTFCSTAAVVPVLVVNDPASARPLADALVAGGLPILEVTLRTEAALECIREMAQGDGVVGAGTVMTPRDVEAAVAAGARFAVSPGATGTLLDAAEDAGLPLLPGAATASEVMRLRERGYSMQKFFPAEASGGVTALKNLAGPLPQVSFCPTGGGPRRQTPRTICHCPTWSVSADRGWRRPTRSPQATGRASRRWPSRERRSPRRSARTPAPSLTTHRSEEGTRRLSVPFPGPGPATRAVTSTRPPLC